MRYEEINSIRLAREKIRELEDRIERTRDIIAIIIKTEPDSDFVNSLTSTRNRRIGQFKRQIKHHLADIKLMENINKLSNEKIY